jgi:hypothetical protein
MNEKTFENKLKFIKALEFTLTLDDRSNVEDIVLRYDPKHDDEYINIFFTGGGRKEIYATGNSNSANMKAILKAVYE